MLRKGVRSCVLGVLLLAAAVSTAEADSWSPA
jgi:hypothetical protein